MNINKIDVNQNLKLYEASKNEKNEKDIVKNNAAGADTAKSAVSKAENHDKITISSEAKNLNILDFAKSKIKDEIEGDAGIKNAEKINALKAQIKSGEYITSSIEIAGAIIGGGYV